MPRPDALWKKISPGGVIARRKSTALFSLFFSPPLFSSSPFFPSLSSTSTLPPQKTKKNSSSFSALSNPSKMVKHNNVVPNQHFKKKWQFYVKTWFNQPARKERRHAKRVAKAKRVFPRPAAGALRPVVTGQTVRYNLRKRAGRGFSLAELKEAGIAAKAAPTLGIAVDHRRRNRSAESLAANASRLKAYKAALVVFPRKAGKPKAGDSDAAALSAAVAQHTGALFPIAPKAAKPAKLETASVDAANKAYYTLRLERTNAKLAGMRKKRAEDEAKEEAAAAK